LLTDQREYVFRLPRREVVAWAIFGVAVLLAFLGYVFALGAAELRPVLFALAAGWTVLLLALRLGLTRRALWGPHPALTAEGIRLRTGLFRARTMVPWAQVHLVWIDTYLGNRNLAVLRRGEGVHKVRYLPLPADPASTDGLDEALRRLSGGEVNLAEHGPEDDGFGLPRGARIGPQFRRPPVRTVPAKRLLISVPVLLLVLPVLLALPEPWNQPWWPGGHRALRAPDPCAVLSPRDVLSTAPTRVTADSGGQSECTAGEDGDKLVVGYTVFTALVGSSIQKASDAFDTAYPASPVRTELERLSLGDECWIAGKTSADSNVIYMGPTELLTCRSGNVVVQVSYTGLADPSVVRPAVIAIGTRAVQAIRFG
jgi:hypothetical protein